jgi:hypothetical protein
MYFDVLAGLFFSAGSGAVGAGTTAECDGENPEIASEMPLGGGDGRGEAAWGRGRAGRP